MAIKIGGTIVIDNSRNLTSIGTITAGTITSNGKGVPVFVSGESTLNANTNSGTISYGVIFNSKPAIQGYRNQPDGFPNPCGEYGGWSTCFEGREKFGTGSTVTYGYHYYDVTNSGFKWSNEGGYVFTLYWTAVGLIS